MSLNKYINRLERMDRLIRRKATGTPTEFAEKLEMSRSLIMEYLRFMRKRGARIVYDRNDQSYKYEIEQEFFCGFKSYGNYLTNMGQDSVHEPKIIYLKKLAS